MKTSSILIGVLAIGAAGAAGAVLVLVTLGARYRAAEASQVRAVASPDSPAESGAGELVQLRSRCEDLESALVRLSGEVAALQAERLRRPVEEVAAVESSADASAAAAAAAARAFTPEQREAVAQIIGEERTRLEREREEQRKAAEQKVIESRAAAIAKELGFGPADERKLSDMLVTYSDKRDAMFRDMREQGFSPEMRDTVGARFGELRTEYKDALTKAFGAENAETISRMTSRGPGDWGGGPGGPGGGFSGFGGGNDANRGGQGRGGGQ